MPTSASAKLPRKNRLRAPLSSTLHANPPTGAAASRPAFLSHVLWLLLQLLIAAALIQPAHAQTIDLQAQRQPITSIAADWRTHPGDDPRYALPAFDDASWKLIQPSTNWVPQGYSEQNGFAWFRFRLRLPPGMPALVLQMPRISKSYQLFADGALVAAIGSMPPDKPGTIVAAPRLFTIPLPAGHPPELTLALRLWQQPAFRNIRPSVLQGQALAGPPAAMLRQFATARAAALLTHGGEYTRGVITTIIAAASLILFLLTRERFYLWFAASMAIAGTNLPLTLATQHFGWPFALQLYAFIVTDLLTSVTLAMFLLGALNLGSRRSILLVVTSSFLAEMGPVLLILYNLPAAWANGIYFTFGTFTDLVLFWLLVRGWRAHVLDARLLLFPFLIETVVGELSDLGHFLQDLGVTHIDWLFTLDNEVLHSPFSVTLHDIAVTGSLLGFLSVLVYRFARTSREEHRLASALQAARDIQNRLVPIDIPRLGGLHTEIAYLAAEEVGGDFCQVLPRDDGSILVAIGDVSGKGLQAAMLGTLAVGALRSMTHESIQPAEALHRLNETILRTEDAGFITCLCLTISPGGLVTLSNAGHLAPYLNGREVSLTPGLPLGILLDITYEESTLTLPHGARLTLLSDGVVEARSRSGELLGFERTCALSHLPAAQIAAVAHKHGQEDDITILTLDWALTIPA